jgi:hypothetical protein
LWVLGWLKINNKLMDNNMKTHHVFISYSSKEKNIADAVCHKLEEKGVKCWMAPRDIRPGSSYAKDIILGIEHSEIFLLIFSDKSQKSIWVKKEVERALSKGLTIIPFRIEEILPNEEMEFYISNAHWLDAYNPPVENHIEFLVEKIKELLPVGNEKNKVVENSYRDSNKKKRYIKKISQYCDDDLLKYLEIYRERFPEDKNVTEEFLLANLNQIDDDNHKPLLFALKEDDKIFGIADLSYFVAEKRIFISYIATKNSNFSGEEIILSNIFFDELFNYFENESMPIKEILFETDKDKIFYFFQRQMKRCSLEAYRFDFDYLQPKIPAKNEMITECEYPLILGYIPVCKVKTNIFSKEKVLEIIKFLYFNIYIHIRNTSEKDQFNYLNALLSKYKKILPDNIKLLKD